MLVAALLKGSHVMKLTFFKKKKKKKKNILEHFGVSNSLDPDQDQHSFSPDLGPNCLQRLSADNKSHH